MFRSILAGLPLVMAAIACQLVASHALAAQTVRLPAETAQHHKFPDQLIVEIFKRSSEYKATYPYGTIESLPLSTRINDVRSGTLDVFFALSKPAYEEEFQAIYFPIYRGLLGWRLAIVRASDRDLLQHATTIKDLQQYKAGQGALWGDTNILESNQLPVVKEHKYTNLFRMLDAERFDYFPRGIAEPWLEVERERALNLTVDPHVVLRYTAPFYFFVRKGDTALANHIKQILEDMLADGSFMALYYQNEEIRMAFSLANLGKRQIIELNNPHLSANTPIDRPELWVSKQELLQRSNQEAVQ